MNGYSKPINTKNGYNKPIQTKSSDQYIKKTPSVWPGNKFSKGKPKHKKLKSGYNDLGSNNYA